MAEHYDFKREWKKTKDQLSKLSRQVLQAAKKGEREFIELSRKSKIHVDSTALTLKKEHLYYMLGKEYASIHGTNKPQEKLSRLLSDLKKADKQLLAFRRCLKMSKKTAPDQ